MSREEGQQGKPGLEVTEEAVRLAREVPLVALAVYYIGSLPFVLGVIVFWATMRQSVNAHLALSGHALLLALLFVWMKTWHTRFCQHLQAYLRGVPPTRWSVSAFARTAANQAAIQSTGFLLLPIAALITIPFGWVYATYQNVTVLDGGQNRSLRELVRDAAAQAVLWPRQNHVVIWLSSPFLLLVVAGFFLAGVPAVQGLFPLLVQSFVYVFGAILLLTLMPLSPLGVVIAVDIGGGILLTASLLRTFLGMDTVFTVGGAAAFNSTFVAIVCGLAFLCMDPVLKAAYVLRCFYGQALTTGEDLRLRLRRCARAVSGLLILAAAVAAFSGQGVRAASETVVEAQQLDRALDQELAHWRYAWRMPRELSAHGYESGIAEQIQHMMQWIKDTIGPIVDKLGDWWDRWFGGRDEGDGWSLPSLASVQGVMKLLLVVLCVVLVLTLALFLYRLWRDGRERGARLTEAAMPAVPDIEDENTAADQLPEEGWLAMAQEFIDQGELRLAVRALFLATLARLAHLELIRVACFKSNRDYLRELGRRAHVHPGLAPLFTDSVRTYESVWYGRQDPAAHGTLEVMRDRIEQLRQKAFPDAGAGS